MTAVRVSVSPAVDRLVELISGSPVVTRHVTDDGRIDWPGLLCDHGLSSGEMRIAGLAFRLGRESGHIEWTDGEHGSQDDQILQQAQRAAARIDVLDILNHVDALCSAGVIEAVWLQYRDHYRFPTTTLHGWDAS